MFALEAAGSVIVYHGGSGGSLGFLFRNIFIDSSDPPEVHHRFLKIQMKPEKGKRITGISTSIKVHHFA